MAGGVGPKRSKAPFQYTIRQSLNSRPGRWKKWICNSLAPGLEFLRLGRSTMFAESDIENRNPLELILIGAFQMIVVLLVCWFGTRSHRSDFRLSRVARLTLFCLVTGLPFALIAYLLRPWDWRSPMVRVAIVLPVLMPLITAFVLGFIKRLRKSTHDTPHNAA